MADQVTRVINELNSLSERVVRKITLDVTANLIDTTPVDTGWARANWVPKIGSPAETPETPSGRENIESSVPGAQAKQRQATAAMLSYRLEMGKVSISNGVPYIKALNEGSSSKAPAGFVDNAVDKALKVDLVGAF